MTTHAPTLGDYAALDVEIADGWANVWFNSPENRNALTGERAADLRRLCAALHARRDIRGVVFRGRGEMFCAGGDLKAFGQIFQKGGDFDAVYELSAEGGALFDDIAALPQYTVMAIEGAAMAGGFGLACIGDYVIATDSAILALSETRIGLTPAQIAPFVVQRLGPRVGRQLMMLGARLTGLTAVDIGMVDELVSDSAAMDAALAEQRRRLKAVAPGALAAIKTQLAAMPYQTRAEQRDAAATSFAHRMLSDEGREGVMSFMQKRKPKWAESE